MKVQHKAINDDDFLPPNNVELQKKYLLQQETKLVNINIVKKEKSYKEGKKLADEAAALLNW
ncbi:hypothetical protein [Kosakonia oryzae]|uniref:hypothetical protein n=1 Tax=Kosakonia oryzae TaxID=497725 RepID=UPI001D08B075|nr:hypothetical protein [Kosakonia oryzae]UDJ82600.1 hypothetical protein I5186_00375 [Kosakonia oryzae]